MVDSDLLNDAKSGTKDLGSASAWNSIKNVFVNEVDEHDTHFLTL